MAGEISAKERGEFLEDTIGDLFKSWGFDVQKRVKLRDKYDVEHEIDVLGTKKEAFGTVVIAVECKYVKSPIDIKEVRNFHDKLSALGIMKGMMVSVGGFTSDANSHAKAVGLELWDLATLQEKIRKVEAPKDRIDDALPLAQGISAFILPSHLTNKEKLTIAGEIGISYAPLYLVEYHCFSQDRVGGEIFTLESKGIIAVSAWDGTIRDVVVSSGFEPNLPKSKGYVDCRFLEPKTLYLGQLIPKELPISKTVTLTPPKIRETEAKSIAQKEVTKGLAVTKKYTVGRKERQKIIRPKKKDVEITGCKLYNIPFLRINLEYRGKAYIRFIQAATGKVVHDESLWCLICKKPSSTICEICGIVACERHSKQCLTCGKKLCDNCVVSKGLVFKKYYCKEHA